jgi:hypothetical protein
MRVRKAYCIFALLLTISDALRSQSAGGKCPQFAPEESIRKITPQDRIFRFDGGYVAVVNEVRLDTDGSPVAYHPRNKGTTDLCNGLDPIIDGTRETDKGTHSPCFAAVRAAINAEWRRDASPAFCVYGFYAPGTKTKQMPCNAWGGAFGKGEIPRQGRDDPAPGFFISTTATHNPGVFADDRQAKYLNSDRIPYAVVPQELVAQKLLPRTGIAWAWNPKSDRSAAGVFGDTQSKFGEISVAFAQKLEQGQIHVISPAAFAGASAIPWPYGRKKTGAIRLTHSPSAPVVFVYLSQSPTPALSTYDPEAIATAVTRLLQRFGGSDRLKECVQPLLHEHITSLVAHALAGPPAGAGLN